MRTAKLLLGWMYLHLALSVIVPVAILLCREWNAAGVGLLLLYIAEITVLQILGWTAVAAASRACRRGDLEALRQGWRLLKLGGVPFHVLNGMYTLFAWAMLIGASRGIMVLLLPIPLLIVWSLIIQSGLVGCCWIRVLRMGPDGGPSGIHYALQLFPVLDILSTVLLLWRGSRTDTASDWY